MRTRRCAPVPPGHFVAERVAIPATVAASCGTRHKRGTCVTAQRSITNVQYHPFPGTLPKIVLGVLIVRRCLGRGRLRDGSCSCPSGKSDAGKPLPQQDLEPHLVAPSREDFDLLEPYLGAVDLPVRKPLEARKKRIDQVYFIETGFAFVVANGPNRRSIEVGIIIGREGMTGLAITTAEQDLRDASAAKKRQRPKTFPTVARDRSPSQNLKRQTQ
jgi:hypothetical protein